MKKVLLIAFLAASFNVLSQSAVQIGGSFGNTFVWDDGYNPGFNYGGEFRYIPDRTRQDRTEFTLVYSSSYITSTEPLETSTLTNSQVSLGFSRFHNLTQSEDFQHGPIAGLGVAKNFGKDGVYTRSSWDIQPSLGYHADVHSFYFRLQLVQGLGTLMSSNNVSQTDFVFSAGINIK